MCQALILAPTLPSAGAREQQPGRGAEDHRGAQEGQGRNAQAHARGAQGGGRAQEARGQAVRARPRGARAAARRGGRARCDPPRIPPKQVVALALSPLTSKY